MKRVFFAMTLGFIAMQFIRPERSAKIAPAKLDLLEARTPPAVVKLLFLKACYDCHSNNTDYPWYSQIQPVYALLDNHVKRGREVVNFSEFGRLPPTRAAQALEDCADEVSQRRMPLVSYRLAHAEARLTDEEIAQFVEWADKEAEALRGSK
ncbi:MAG: heme-binding domain-containing protein [Nibricoccus sp.]